MEVTIENSNDPAAAPAQGDIEGVRTKRKRLLVELGVAVKRTKLTNKDEDPEEGIGELVYSDWSDATDCSLSDSEFDE